MSDNENGDLFDTGTPPQTDLLDELGSLKDLLDEELESSAPPASVHEIRSVKEYMQLKEEADAAGVSLEEFLARRAAEAPAEEGDDEAIPMLDEVVELDELPLAEVEETEAAAVAEVEEAIPTLDEVYEVAETAAAGDYSLEEVERMVHQLVSQKLEEIRPQLEKQIFDQIRNMLPVDLFK